MSTLRERLIARAHEFASGHYTKADRAELIVEGARMALEEAARICDEYPQRDPGGDGSGYWAADECARSIMRALRDGLE